MTKIFIICFLFVFSFSQCNQTDKPATKEYLKGIWKGVDSGKIVMLINFKDDSQVEIKGCTRDGNLIEKDSDARIGTYNYQLYSENNKTVLKIENHNELFYPIKRGANELVFGLSDVDSRQPILPVLADLSFYRAEQMLCK